MSLRETKGGTQAKFLHKKKGNTKKETKAKESKDRQRQWWNFLSGAEDNNPGGRGVIDGGADGISDSFWGKYV